MYVSRLPPGWRRVLRPPQGYARANSDRVCHAQWPALVVRHRWLASAASLALLGNVSACASAVPTTQPLTPTRASTPTRAAVVIATATPQPAATATRPAVTPTQPRVPTATPAARSGASVPAGLVTESGGLSPGAVLPLNKDDCPPTHPVKGNQGSRSTEEWIYHVPGGRSYAATDPGERFATAADAEAAHYRAPVR